MTHNKYLAPAGIALVTAAAIAVTFSLSQDDSGATATPTRATITFSAWGASEEATGQQVREKAQLAFESFAGTVEEQNAVGVVRAYHGNRAMDDCMAAAGFPEWDWSLSRTYADPDDPLKTNVWLAEPLGRWRSEDLLAAKRFFEAEAVMNADDQPADESTAVTSCLDAAQTRTSDIYGNQAPRASERLSSQWWNLIRDFRADAMPSPNVYENCLDAANIAILDDHDLPPFEVGEAMSLASPPDADIPADPADPNQWSAEGWQKFLQEEDEYVTADWNCRQDVYRQHIGDLEPVIASFVTDHAGEISATKEAWSQIVDRAAELGYHGQSGPLSG